MPVTVSADVLKIKANQSADPTIKKIPASLVAKKIPASPIVKKPVVNPKQQVKQPAVKPPVNQPVAKPPAEQPVVKPLIRRRFSFMAPTIASQRRSVAPLPSAVLLKAESSRQRKV
jgi:hypothetical protein